MILAKLSVRLRRALWTAAALLAIYTVAGFFVLPPIVRSQLEKRGSAASGRTVTVAKVRLNPYTLSASIQGLNVSEAGGSGSFVSWNRLDVNFGLLASLSGDWVLRQVDLDGFHSRVLVKPDGTLNFSDLLAKASALAAPAPGAAPSSPPRPIRIDALHVTEARVDFSDLSRSQPFQTIIGPLHFDLSQFRTAGGKGAPYHFEAATETGEKFRWSGTLTAAPLSSKGEFAIENLDLKKYAPYYEQAMRADVAAGKLSVQGRYEADLSPQGRVLRLFDGGVRLAGLRVNERANGQAAFELASLEISGLDADAIARKARVGRVAATGGRLSVRRDGDGTLNLVTLSQPAAAGPAASASPMAAGPAAPLPEVTVGEVSLADFSVAATDLAGPRPVQLALSGIQFTAKDIAPASTQPMSLQASLQWAPHGTVSFAGTIGFRPVLSADLKTDVSDLAILPLSPYLETFARVRLTQGSVSAQNRIQVALRGPSPEATLSGDVLVKQFGLVDGVNSEDLAGVSSLALTGLKVATAPRLSVSLDEVTVAGPTAHVIVGKGGQLNLAEIAPPPAGASPPAGAPARPGAAGPLAEMPQIEIRKVTVTGGEFTFADRSLQPNVTVAMSQFEGHVDGLSSGNRGRAEVDLTAAVDGVGPVSIKGTLDPLVPNPSVDLKLAGRSVDLLPLSPYSGKFAGYEIARGNVFVDVAVKVADRRIDMTNVVTLNQFTFGDPVNSPEATKLPVRLGVALLKDLNGQIVVDLPVQGDLADPNFRVGKVVVRVIVNLLVKAAVSPFSLLGSVFGGGGEELSYQEFSPGSSALKATEAGKLATLEKALTNRPGLNLDIEGSFDRAADTYALKRQKLEDLLRRKIWEERRAADPNIPPPEQLTVTDAERLAMLKTLFDAKFPPGSDLGTPLPPPPAVVPPPPPPRPGFFQRIVAVVTFEEPRRQREEKKQEAQATAAWKGATAAAVAAGLPAEEMSARMADTMEVTPDDLRALAAERGQSVRDDLVNQGKIPPGRLFLAKPPIGAEAAQAGKGPRVFFQLH